MDAGLAAVIGAGIGGATAIVGSFATTVLSARATRSQWRRSQAADGYANSLRYLTRAVAVRSRFTSRGRAVLSKDDVHQFFVDLADAEHSLAIAAAFSGLRAPPHAHRPGRPEPDSAGLHERARHARRLRVAVGWRP